jgi:hypothetical protein
MTGEKGRASGPAAAAAPALVVRSHNPAAEPEPRLSPLPCPRPPASAPDAPRGAGAYRNGSISALLVLRTLAAAELGRA